MSVEVKRKDQTSIYVNDKIVTMDKNGNYQPIVESLTSAEDKSLNEFLNSEKLNLKNRLN